MVSGFGSIWVQSTADGSLWRIGPEGHVQAKILQVFSTGRASKLDQPAAVGFSSVWTLMGRSVVRIDAATNLVSDRISLPAYAEWIAKGPDAMWVATNGPPRLLRIYPETGKETATRGANPLVSPAGLGVGFDAIWWVNGSEAASVSRIDPANGYKSTYIPLPEYARFVVPTERYVWLIGQGRAAWLDPSDNTISRHAPRKAAIALGVTYADGTIWINDGGIVGFDARTGEVTTQMAVAGQQDYQSVAGIAVLGSDIWLVDPADQRVVRVPRAT
jgi:hypothetical protein